MIEELSLKFVEEETESNAFNLINFCRRNNLFDIGFILGKYFSKKFENSVNIIDEYGIISYYKGEHKKSYEIYKNLLETKNLDLNRSKFLIFNQHFSIESIINDFILYDINKVNSILNRKKSQNPQVTLSITTCKRFDLFEKTINSVLNCFDIDMIDHWFCVDDNSSEEDRKKMKELYPFFTFYFKTFEEKGHCNSMNIIKKHVLEEFKTPYLVHLEDDWKFYDKKDYIKNGIKVLNDNEKIGQCLFNRNYAEVPGDINIAGGDFQKTKDNFRYYLHEYTNTDEKKIQWFNKHGNKPSSNYWPHFSFRPSILKTSIFQNIGDFNKDSNHFEMEYANRYFDKDYISAFFEGVYCRHIGRLTTERNNDNILNAYKLNNEDQFIKKNEKVNENNEINKENENIDNQNKKQLKIKTYVINLDKRPDRWETFKKNAQSIEFLQYDRFAAIDGSKLKSNAQLQRIFDNNDYNMRCGIVGAAMSQIKLYIELIKSDIDIFFILEDDVEFTDDFQKKFLHVFHNVIHIKNDWDIIMLGHSVRYIKDFDLVYKKDVIPNVEQWNKNKSFEKSIGGAFGYLISKKGARNLLNLINKTGMTNALDTMFQNFSDILNVFYCTPHLVITPCVRQEMPKVDSNIQYDYNSLTVHLENRIQQEIQYYLNKQKNIYNIESYEKALLLSFDININNNTIYFYKDNENNINNIILNCIHPYYTLEKTVIFIVPNGDNNRYFHRFKKNGEFNIDDAIIENI
jgi:GR25 family glycosyltransferase involved in LPS biosynthesis